MMQYLLTQISAKTDFIQKHNDELQVEVLMARNLKNICCPDTSRQLLMLLL